jgi:hypothetical protein
MVQIHFVATLVNTLHVAFENLGHTFNFVGLHISPRLVTINAYHLF